jgi:hypothetical protein
MFVWNEGVGPWMVVGSALMLPVWAGLTGLVIWSVARLTRRSHNQNVAIVLARERYAREEVSRF